MLIVLLPLSSHTSVKEPVGKHFDRKPTPAGQQALREPTNRHLRRYDNCRNVITNHQSETSDRGNRPITSSPDPGRRASPTAGWGSHPSVLRGRGYTGDPPRVMGRLLVRIMPDSARFDGRFGVAIIGRPVRAEVGCTWSHSLSLVQDVGCPGVEPCVFHGHRVLTKARARFRGATRRGERRCHRRNSAELQGATVGSCADSRRGRAHERGHPCRST